MSGEMGFEEIIQTLKQLFNNVVSRQDRREGRGVSVDFRGFQAPLKDWQNSGNFSPGVATDKRHPNGHDGLDMRAPIGTNVYSISPGTVKQVYNDPKGGLAIIIDHPGNIRSYYAHLNSANVKVSDEVGYDTVIGNLGYSGNAHPTRGGGVPHVHLQTWVNGALTNPGKFFPVKPYTPFDPQKELMALPGVTPRREPKVV